MRLSDPDELARRATELIERTENMAISTDVREVQRADDEWYASLLAACPNRRLLAMIADTKRIVHRYEHAYLADLPIVRESVEQHQRIA